MCHIMIYILLFGCLSYSKKPDTHHNENVTQAIARSSKGGLSTKIYATCDALGNPTELLGNIMI